MSTGPEIVRGATPVAHGMNRYLAILIGFSLCVLAIFLLAAMWLSYDRGVAHDYFSEIARNGDKNWYRDFGGRRIPQIQDQDIFFSKIGSSIAAAKGADIVFLGPSFVSYAVDRDTLRVSPQLDRLNIYNMAFVGLRGGEFSRRVIKRWNIKPPLWVINVDDQFVHFFSNDLSVTLGPQKTPITAIERNRLRGYLTVVGRNLHWRIEDLIAPIQTGQDSPIGIYRNVANGDMALENNPGYVANGNKPMRLARDPSCHTSSEVIDYARRFLKEIGGRAVFTLVPHSQACVQQAAELAKALNVELIAPPFDGLTTVDGGGHLDKNGAEIFTRYLAAELIRAEAFKQAFATKVGEAK
jgi:hypothetical protein